MARIKSPTAAAGPGAAALVLAASALALGSGALQAGERQAGGLAPVTWECLADCSRRFEVPLAALLMVMGQEAGQVGRSSLNQNGTRDLGPMQINTVWLGTLSALGIGEALVRDDGCVNLAVGAWILRSHLRRTGSLARAVADYHSRRPEAGQKYLGQALARAKRLSVAAALARANGAVEEEEAGR